VKHLIAPRSINSDDRAARPGRHAARACGQGPCGAVSLGAPLRTGIVGAQLLQSYDHASPAGTATSALMPRACIAVKFCNHTARRRNGYAPGRYRRRLRSPGRMVARAPALALPSLKGERPLPGIRCSAQRETCVTSGHDGRREAGPHRARHVDGPRRWSGTALLHPYSLPLAAGC